MTASTGAMDWLEGFDPDGAGDGDAGVFGLPTPAEQARITLIPVPFDATASYWTGSAEGPEAIREASLQVDLHDEFYGAIYRAGIFMEEHPSAIASLSDEARALTEPIIERGGVEAGDAEASPVDAMSERVRAHVYERAKAALGRGAAPGVIGGEHSVSLGAIQACAEARHEGIGVLQLDAHMDLRAAYEGFAQSHASILWNVLERVPGVTKLVQVGIRDTSAGEWAYARSQGERVAVHTDRSWRMAQMEGTPSAVLIEGAINQLPKRVYITMDIDGLDPSMCPGTGTPVPGGLSWGEACALIAAVAQSGREIVGFDVVEVCPTEGDRDWNANVGARALYQLCGATAMSRGWLE